MAKCLNQIRFLLPFNPDMLNGPFLLGWLLSAGRDCKLLPLILSNLHVLGSAWAVPGLSVWQMREKRAEH